MNIELLKTFLEVSRTRHFGRAAETLYLTQSAISSRIRQLENEISANLFTRHRNNICLTPAGEKFQPYAEAIIRTWQNARKNIAHTFMHDKFSIGASASLWECILSRWLSRLYLSCSHLQFDTRVAHRQLLVKQLHERQLDLLITTEAPKIYEFNSQILSQFSLTLYASEPSRIRSELNYLHLDWGSDFQQCEEVGLITDDNNVPQLITSSAEIVCQQLPYLRGCTWLPTFWADKKPGLYTVVDSAILACPLYAIWLQNSDKQTQIRNLLKISIID